MDDEQKEALTNALSAFDSAEAFASALQKERQSYYQTVYDKGHQDGLGQVNDERDRLKSKVDNLKQEKQSLQEEVETLREETPDAESLREQWEESELQPVREKAETYETRYKEARRSQALSQVKERLADEVRDPWVAEKLVEDAKERVAFDGDDARFLRPDGQTPYAAGDEQDPASLMAEDLLDDIPEKLRADTRNGNGAGFNNGQAPEGQGVKSRSDISRSERADLYEQWRNEGKDPNEEWQKLPE